MAKKRTQRRVRAKALGGGILTALSILVPPLGIWYAWRRRGLKTPARFALTFAAVALAFVYVTLIPGASTPPRGGVEFIQRKPQAEIYGPELPEDMVAGYQAPSSVENVLSTATDEPVTYVYTNDGEETFHTTNCKRRYATSARLTPYEAYYLNLTPCEICNPPTYTPTT